MTRKKYCEDNDLCFISMTECDAGTCFETVIHPEIGKVKVRAKYKNAVNLLKT